MKAALFFCFLVVCVAFVVLVAEQRKKIERKRARKRYVEFISSMSEEERELYRVLKVTDKPKKKES